MEQEQIWRENIESILIQTDAYNMNKLFNVNGPYGLCAVKYGKNIYKDAKKALDEGDLGFWGQCWLDEV